MILNKVSYIVGIQARHNSRTSYTTETVANHKPTKPRINGIANGVDNLHHNGGIILNNKNVINDELNKSINVDPNDVGALKELSKTSGLTSEESKNLDYLIQRLSSKDEDHTFKGEWRIVAMTIDRCLFIFFVTIFILTTIACFAHTTYIT